MKKYFSKKISLPSLPQKIKKQMLSLKKISVTKTINSNKGFLGYNG